MASLVLPPCRQAPFRCPEGAPARPPCSLHLPFRLFPIRWQGFPPRVFAPHRVIVAKGFLFSVICLSPWIFGEGRRRPVCRIGASISHHPLPLSTLTEPTTAWPPGSTDTCLAPGAASCAPPG